MNLKSCQTIDLILIEQGLLNIGHLVLLYSLTLASLGVCNFPSSYYILAREGKQI